jgi:hypothetical protein
MIWTNAESGCNGEIGYAKSGGYFPYEQLASLSVHSLAQKSMEDRSPGIEYL